VERLGGNILDLLTNLGRQVIQDEHPTNFAAAALIARSVLKTMLEGMYEGSGSCIGMPALRAGDQIEIRGLGKRFSGRYRLSKVTHSINSGGYQTRFEVSQKANLNLLGSMRDKITERPSPNGKQPIYGVLVGEVTLNNDPKHLGQVQVKIDVLSDQPLPAWAYLATSMAGVDKGLYFLPAVGDRVLVAFEKGNVNKPYVVGTLWHGEAHPPDAGSTPGEQKVIQTKSGLQVLFDEAQGKERLVLKDKAGASITLDSTKDAEKTVIERPMPQKKVATISLDAGAKQIVIEYAQSQIIVKENGDISIIAHHNLNLTAQGDITLDATNVKVKVSATGTMDVSERT
jgi:uncharacterized protein involved in type VI secretion and phage assembly